MLSRSWLKYFVYYPTTKEVGPPKAFFINSAFNDQFKGGKNPKLEEADEFGPINIPSDKHFWVTLTKQGLYVT